MQQCHVEVFYCATVSCGVFYCDMVSCRVGCVFMYFSTMSCVLPVVLKKMRRKQDE